MNIFEERGDDLVALDYGDILDAVLKGVQRNERLFVVSEETGRLMANVSEVASRVSNKPFGSPLVGPGRKARTATVNFFEGNGGSPPRAGVTGSGFHEKVRAIQNHLQEGNNVVRSPKI